MDQKQRVETLLKFNATKVALRYITTLRTYFDRWTKAVAAQDSEILEGITGEAVYLKHMRPAENRQILRSARMPDNRAFDNLTNMTDRLYELSKLKEKVPKIGLKKWMEALDKNRAAN